MAVYPQAHLGEKDAEKAAGSRNRDHSVFQQTASQIWQRRLYFRPRGRDFVVVSFFEGKTDGFETN
jgi:hypothetical protein